MACTSKYFNIAGAGLCGIGSGIGIFAGAGTPATVAAVIATLGSIAWLISAIMDLVECLEAAGHHAEADRFRERANGLQQEYDRLVALVS
jgi:hypothetical protein